MLQVINDMYLISEEEHIQHEITFTVLTFKSLIKHFDGSKSTSNLFLSSSALPFKSLGKKKG